MAKLLSVEENSAPPIKLTLKRKVVANDGTISYQVIDLTDATGVDLIIYSKKTKAVTNADHQACTITDAEEGKVTYQPETTDWVDKGSYSAEAKITYAGGTHEIVYEILQIKARKKLTPAA